VIGGQEVVDERAEDVVLAVEDAATPELEELVVLVPVVFAVDIVSKPELEEPVAVVLPLLAAVFGPEASETTPTIAMSMTTVVTKTTTARVAPLAGRRLSTFHQPSEGLGAGDD